MGDLLTVTFPIFALIGLGYATARRGLFDAGDMRALGRFIVQIALPALIFNAIARRDLGAAIAPGYLVAYLAGSTLTAAAGWIVLQRWPGLDRTDRILGMMGTSFTNSGFIGYPILMLTYPAIAGLALAMNMMVENLLMIPAALAALELASSTSGARGVGVLREVAVRLLRQPMMLALVAGLVVALLQLPLPEALSHAVSITANASAALSLFVIGGSLHGRPKGGATRLASVIAAMKLTVHPLAVALMFRAVPVVGLPPVAPELVAAGTLIAAVPMMGIYPVIAQNHGRAGLASLALLIAVVASFATLTVALAVLR